MPSSLEVQHPVGSTCQPPDPARAALHPVWRTRVFRLYAEFKDQHARGVCKVDRFETLLKLKFASEDQKHIDAMMAMVAAKEAREIAAAERLQAVENDVVLIFTALDTDGGGTIGIDEFLRLDRSTGLSKLQLAEIFNRRDVDGNGTLDLDEFRQLADECRLFQSKDSIIELGLSAKREHEIQEFFSDKSNICRLGLPLGIMTKKKPESTKRPSLADVSSLIINFELQSTPPECAVDIYGS